MQEKIDFIKNYPAKVIIIGLTFKCPEVPFASRFGPEASTNNSPLVEFRVKTAASKAGTTAQ